MKVFTVSFFGHRYIDNTNLIEPKLNKIIHDLLIQKEYVEFIVGRNGEFDQLVASAVRTAKKEIRSDNSSLILVLPYLTAEYKKRGFPAFFNLSK